MLQIFGPFDALEKLLSPDNRLLDRLPVFVTLEHFSFFFSVLLEMVNELRKSIGQLQNKRVTVGINAGSNPGGGSGD